MQLLSQNVDVVDPKKVELENMIVSYINKIIEFDKKLERNSNNFFSQEYNSITQSIDKFRQENCRVFIGAGNIFILKIEHKLTGWTASCTQLRGLARRRIIIKEFNEDYKNHT